jgi:predicted O-methyltransferase YrrM
MTGFADSAYSVDDVHAWQILRPILDDGNYLPWTTGTMRPAGMVLVCNDIVHRTPRRIVECGSGVSTVVLARLVRQCGHADVTITSLEHDADWALLVTELLNRESLSDIATVLHAPLQGDPPWYALGELAGLPDEIDLLVVDGPPAFEPGQQLRRAPALAALGSRLGKDSTVVLDDIDRPGEQSVLARWEATTAWRFERHQHAGVAIGQQIASTT